MPKVLPLTQHAKLCALAEEARATHARQREIIREIAAITGEPHNSRSLTPYSEAWTLVFAFSDDASAKDDVEAMLRTLGVEVERVKLRCEA